MNYYEIYFLIGFIITSVVIVVEIVREGRDATELDLVGVVVVIFLWLPIAIGILLEILVEKILKGKS